MNGITWKETIPEAGKYDVIVAGGGLAGIAAALSAARNGASVLLLEKQCWLGGLATTGLINFWVPFCNGRGKMIVRGMAEEFLRTSYRYSFDSLPDEWKYGEPAAPTEKRCAGWFSSGIFALQLLEMLRESGVRILYDALVSAPVMEHGHCCGLIVDSKSGRQFYRAGVVVDATGDADILLKAGVPTRDGRNYCFYAGEGITLDGCRRAWESQDIFKAYSRPTGHYADLYGHFQPEHIPLHTGATLENINDYIQINQLEMLRKAKEEDKNARNIHMLPGIPQLRTARRILGDRTLTMEDCYRHHDDSIGAICDFDHRDRLFEVPYGTLVRTGFDNLITCGRSASGEGWGWDVLRVIPPAILTGQAAGIAAVQSLQSGTSLPALPVEPLQSALAQTGVIIHFDDSWVPKDLREAQYTASEEHL